MSSLLIKKVKVEPVYGILREQVSYQYNIQFKEKELVLPACGSVWEWEWRTSPEMSCS